MISRITIRWQRDKYQTGGTQPAKLFCLGRDEELLYIGYAYKQDISQTIKVKLADLNVWLEEVEVWIGTIDFSESSVKKTSNKIIEDTYLQLVQDAKPIHNPEWTRNYLGRRFNIRSKGCHFFADPVFEV